MAQTKSKKPKTFVQRWKDIMAKESHSSLRQVYSNSRRIDEICDELEANMKRVCPTDFEDIAKGLYPPGLN